MTKELLGAPFYPPKDTKLSYPACEYSEVKWFSFLCHAYLSRMFPIHPKHVAILTWDDKVIGGSAIQKNDGTEPTLLILDGTLTGVVAANMRCSEHLQAFRLNERAPQTIQCPKTVDALAMRPFVITPQHFDTHKALELSRRMGIPCEGLELPLFPTLFINLLDRLGLEIDKRKFMRNIRLFEQAIARQV